MRSSRPAHHAPRLLATASAIVGSIALIAAAPSPVMLPGMTYTVQTKSAPVGDGPTASVMAAMSGGYTGVVVFAAGRGRMDITDGSQAHMFAKGDYVLFDSSDYIIVHPADKTFYTVPDMSAAFASPAASGMTMKVTNVSASIDTLGAGEPVSGFATEHFRTTQAYTMTVDMGGMDFGLGNMTPPPTQTKSSSEYWFADIPSFPPNPLGGVASSIKSAMAGPMKELSDEATAVQHALPLKKIAVKAVTSTRMTGGAAMGMDVTMEMSNIKPLDVDPALLVLPDGYTQTAMPGMEALSALGGASAPLLTDSGAKWRVKPGGGL